MCSLEENAECLKLTGLGGPHKTWHPAMGINCIMKKFFKSWNRNKNVSRVSVTNSHLHFYLLFNFRVKILAFSCLLPSALKRK